MGYSIDEIQGIGPAYKEKLNSAEIKTTEALLEHCATKTGRSTFSEKTGVTETLILDWVNMADMMRINGVGGQFSELLKATGVDTVKELRTRNAENLTAALTTTNDEKNLAKTVPSVEMVTKWIEEAKTLEPVVTHQAFLFPFQKPSS